jgi:outer membrane lipoprotein-sorting protein
MSRRLTAVLLGALTLAALCLPRGAWTQEPNAARALMDQVRELNRTARKWTDSTQDISVTVYTSRGGERKQQMRLLTKKYGDDVTRTVVSFLEPPAIRGMSVLQWAEAHKANVTWLYSPEIGTRPRQFNGSSQRDSFSGTDFSYEDLSIRGEIAEWTPEEAAAELLRDEMLDGRACAVIEVVPRTVDVTYKKIRLWLSRDDLVVRKFEFEDDNGRLAKTLLLSDVRTVGQVPTAHRLEMVNERGKSRTVAVFDKVTYDQGLEDALFSQRFFEDES